MPRNCKQNLQDYKIQKTARQKNLDKELSDEL